MQNEFGLNKFNFIVNLSSFREDFLGEGLINRQSPILHWATFHSSPPSNFNDLWVFKWQFHTLRTTVNNLQLALGEHAESRTIAPKYNAEIC